MNQVQEKPEMSQDARLELQIELIRLQRQYRYLEDDRNAYKEEAAYELKKQTGIIKSLEEEEEELMKESKLAKSRRNVLLDLDNLKRLQDLLDHEGIVKRKLEAEKENCKTLDQDIAKKREEIDEQRIVMGGCHMSEEDFKNTDKRIRVLGNRLDQMNVKYNMALAENAKYRNDIDHITAQRDLFTDIHKKLKKLYEHGKLEKERLIESSTGLFHVRDEAEHRMQSLKERSERDWTQYNSELKDLLRIIDHDKNLREFMTTKAEERAEQFEKLAQVRKEKKLKAHVSALKLEVERYEEIFDRLGEVSGLTNIDEIVNKFVKTEDQNFALFNYVKDQNNQIQYYEGEILKLKQEKSLIDKGDVAMSKERKVILRELQEKVEKTAAQSEMHVKLHKEEKKLFEKLKVATAEMFPRVGCSRTALSDILGDSEITNDNLLRFIGVIEQRCNELLQAKLVLASKEGNEHEVTILQNILTGTVTKEVKQFYRAPSIVLDHEQLATGQNGNAAVEQPLTDKETRTSAVNELATLTKKYAVEGNETNASKKKADKKKKEH